MTEFTKEESEALSDYIGFLESMIDEDLYILDEKNKVYPLLDRLRA